MSKASDIQNALNALIEATLPEYVKLPDAYDSPDNPVLHLEKGYSVGFGAGVNNSDNFCKGEVRVERSYQVILTNTYVPNLDANYRESLEQSLMDDHFAIIGAVECEPTLSGVSISSQYSSDEGIEYIIGENKQFIAIVSIFLIDYIEGV